MRGGRSLYIILLVLIAGSMMMRMNADPIESRSRNVYEMMDILPLALVLGIPMLMFGCMIYFLMKDNGRTACLITSSIYLGGMVSVGSSLLMPIEQDVFIFAIVLLAFGAFVGTKIFKDLKEKNYL
jgi:hypothetical protein